jgi:hypothetical protein
VGCQVCDAADSVALYLDVWAEHLAYEGLETAELDDQDLVVI